MAYLTMKQLLEAGVHFGHQTKRWNPKMKPYIFGARNGIYIVDLQQTVKLFNAVYDLVKKITSEGGTVLFVGTKKQAQNSIEEESKRCGMNYINQRWMGGLLTNFATVGKSIKRLKELDEMKESGGYSALIKKEALMLERKRLKLEKNLGGIRAMTKAPDAVFVIDTRRELIAVREARKLGIPVIGVVDTNCDPDEVDHVIPGNDDAIRAIRLFSSAIADACMEGRALYEESLVAASDKEQAAEGEGAEGPGEDKEQASVEAGAEPESAPSEGSEANEKAVDTGDKKLGNDIEAEAVEATDAPVTGQTTES